MLGIKKLNQKVRSAKKRIQIEYRMWRQPVVEIEGIKVPVGRHMNEVIQNFVYSGEYEKPELELVKSHLLPNDIVMEVGAGVGLVSSYCAKEIGSERVFAYEANPVLEQHIRNTYKLNNVAPTLEICLIGEQIGEQIFYAADAFWISSAIQPEGQAKAIKVPVKSFNQEVRRINPSFLIMDIEGGEYEILNSPDLHNIQKIVIELHDHIIGNEKVEFVLSQLLQAGFRVTGSASKTLFLQRG